MVEINLYLLLALLQALLVVTVLLGIVIWRLARGARRMTRMRTQLEHLQARPTAIDHLQQELNDARQQGATTEDNAPWAAVRAAYLEFELQRAQTEPSGEPDLQTLQAQLQPLLPGASTPATEEKLPALEIDDENIDFPEMLRRHNQLLQALKAQIHGCVSNEADLQRCDEKFGMLDLVGREMESCTLMMEEENNFLRDQIRALLADSDSEAPQAEGPER